MEVAELATISTDVSPVHPEKAPYPMERTELGIVTDVSTMHPAKV